MWCKQRRKRKDTSNSALKENTDSGNRPSSATTSVKAAYEKNSISPAVHSRGHSSGASATSVLAQSSNGPTDLHSHTAAGKVSSQQRGNSLEPSRPNAAASGIAHSFPPTSPVSSASTSSHPPPSHSFTAAQAHPDKPVRANFQSGLPRPTSQQYYYSTSSSSSSLTPSKLHSAPPTPSVKPLISVPLPSAPLTSNILDSLDVGGSEPSSVGGSYSVKHSNVSTSPSKGDVAGQQLQKVKKEQLSLLQDLSKLYLLTQTVSKMNPRSEPRCTNLDPVLQSRGSGLRGGAGRASCRMVEESQVFDYSNRRNVFLQLEAAVAREEEKEDDCQHLAWK